MNIKGNFQFYILRYGYVQFATVEGATAALGELNGYSLNGRACRLDFATPRDPNGGGAAGGRGRGIKLFIRLLTIKIL